MRNAPEQQRQMPVFPPPKLLPKDWGKVEKIRHLTIDVPAANDPQNVTNVAGNIGQVVEPMGSASNDQIYDSTLYTAIKGFFKEGKPRAASQLETLWGNTKHGFAVVTNFIAFGMALAGLDFGFSRNLDEAETGLGSGKGKRGFGRLFGRGKKGMQAGNVTMDAAEIGNPTAPTATKGKSTTRGGTGGRTHKQRPTPKLGPAGAGNN